MCRLTVSLINDKTEQTVGIWTKIIHFSNIMAWLKFEQTGNTCKLMSLLAGCDFYHIFVSVMVNLYFCNLSNIYTNIN